MKGILFNLLEKVVIQEHGEDAWDALLETSGLSGSYTSIGNYPDEELLQIIGAAAQAFKLSPPEVVHWLGRKAMPLLAERYPEFFEGHHSTRPFLLTLNDIIHPEVRKIYPDAEVPVFDFDTSSQDVLLMSYQSRRHLCCLAHGFIEGAADHFGETATVERLQCMIQGQGKCVFSVTFNGKV